MTNRAERRKGISPIRLHSKAFEKTSLKETVLEDGSIQFDIEWFASTVDKDNDGDVIMPEGIDITRYMNNPIIKAQHGRWLGTNIGKVTTIDIQPWVWMYITCSIPLDPSIEDHKTIIHWLRHWLINWFSIWFSKAKMKYDDTLKANVITSLELYEISLVDIPNNPMTVRKMFEIAEKELEQENSEEITTDEVYDQEETTNEDIENDNTTDEDANDEKTLDVSIKKAVLWDGELPVIGNMYRIKYDECYEWCDECRCYENIYNAECIKISQETDEDGSINYDIYWLIYNMWFDWREPTICVVKTSLDETSIMDLTADQLKELVEQKTKEIHDMEQEQVNEDLDSEQLNNIEWQENAESWNAEGDTDVEDIENEGWNADTDQDQSQKSLDAWIDKDLQITNLTKSLDDANTTIENQKAIISKYDEDLETAVKMIESNIDEIERLQAVVIKTTTNYEKVAALYSTNSEDSKKEHPLKSRVWISLT